MASFTTSPSQVGKKKVLFIMGATGSGKTKLSISLAMQFPSEIINSDKIQIYKGLDIITNKVSESQRSGIPHHLLAIVDDPDYDFTIHDFCYHVLHALDTIVQNGHLPIIVGGSNTYLTALLEDPDVAFCSKYDCCFIWVDVSLPVLFPYLDKRVDEMVDAGVVDEIREAFVAGADCSRGIRRAIGVPELGEFFLREKEIDDEAQKEKMLQHAITKTKENTHKLAERQLSKIRNMNHDFKMFRIDSTQVFEAVLNGVDYKQLYEEIVFKPCMEILKQFLEETTVVKKTSQIGEQAMVCV
ncbi:adenylate isopentenyltransferase 5, chloroplastic-like [Vigna radiata var. radiata]|uniref:adenylate dimethylallyltransferase (ADP/ATP-dependent) n=1 Tax=Vigna radiata var. radiata TaxID=3916 RepID=A0A1S3TT56_VIGRR|nr:adenylate isopentenyltransferase 5, chloroplastic-like [Vigna radiata var. radiata]